MTTVIESTKTKLNNYHRSGWIKEKIHVRLSIESPGGCIYNSLFKYNSKQHPIVRLEFCSSGKCGVTLLLSLFWGSLCIWYI